jgi:hypothetical protein
MGGTEADPVSAEAYEVYRDATFSRETREYLNGVEQFMVAILTLPDVLPQYVEVERGQLLRALRDVMERWDENASTEIRL